MPSWEYENKLWQRRKFIAGIDEAGRGAWAGPVAAAAVIFAPGVVIDGVDDSKKLSPKRREKLFTEIRNRCVACGVALIEPEVIDRVNISEATKQAMLAAISQLHPLPDFLLIDGNFRLPTPLGQMSVIDGDQKSFSIAAASILAKVTRDRFMTELAQKYPKFGFERHKGYGTKIHLQSLKDHGILPIHRRSYKPVQEFAEKSP